MASSGPTSQTTTHDMGRPSGTTRPQAQARRSTLQISTLDLSAEPGKIHSPEKSKNRKLRAERKRAAQEAAIGETIDSDFATLTPEMDTMQVATSDNEPIEKNRKRHRVATVAEEEGAVPAQTPRRRQRSQPSESPEDTTYYGPQNQTEHDAAPTTPSNDAGEARARAKISKHQRRVERAEFQRKVHATIDLRARRQLERMEREMTASLQQTQAPTDGSGNFFSASAGRPQSRA